MSASSIRLAAHDGGIFGPGSVTWRLMGEPIMWVAGLRAMYLQALHPRTIRATWQNTAFARPGEAWGRFARTVEFVRVRTYGTRAEVERAGRRVRQIHATLTGTDADGSVIRLNEPELLLWVHCGEISSYVNIAGRCGLGLSAAELDQFVDEQRRSAAVVGLDPAGVPYIRLAQRGKLAKPSAFIGGTTSRNPVNGQGISGPNDLIIACRASAQTYSDGRIRS